MIFSILLAVSLKTNALFDDLIVRFDKPATHFTESCPVGNGRLGAMMFGGVAHERIVLNEASMWSGWPEAQNRQDAWTHRPQIIELLQQGKNPEAEALVNQYFTSDGPGSGHGNGKDGPYGCYQTLGDLLIDMLGMADEPTNYTRTLDLNRAIATTEFESHGVKYSREILVSHPDSVIALRLRSSKPGALNFKLNLSRKENATILCHDDKIVMTGSLSKFQNYKAIVQAKVVGGGSVSADVGQGLKVSGAQECLIFVSAGTNYEGPIKGNHLGAGFGKKVEEILAKAVERPWNKVVESHVRDYRTLFDRVKLNLPTSANQSKLPTIARMEKVHKGEIDPGFASLYFAFGRYLMISSSRNGGLPSNLQGLWAEEYQTPWNGDYHIDINVQMNYWPVNVCNLFECHRPFEELVASLVKPGQATAKAYYDAPGWVAHVITNPWGYTAPGEEASWGSTYSGSGWLCGNLFDHFAFSQDTAYLKRIFPILKGATDFFRSTLVTDSKSGLKVTGPSNSPENAFRMADGRTAHTCLGPTIDTQIITELLDNTRTALSILGDTGNDDVLIARTLAGLAPMKVAPDGRLQEWLEPYEEPEPQHRHTSHLYGLHPASQINPFGTPLLADAARQTLEKRGDESTGWSMAWKVNFWARLGDGDRAYKLLKSLWTPVSETGFDYGRGGGTYTNLFCAHPPFQIDGNFGATAGIAEMLLQSHKESPESLYTISILPALPKAWPTGSVSGLRARGGFEVSIEWEEGNLKLVTLKRVAGTGPIYLRTKQQVFCRDKSKEKNFTGFDRNILKVELTKGQKITFEPTWE